MGKLILSDYKINEIRKFIDDNVILQKVEFVKKINYGKVIYKLIINYVNADSNSSLWLIPMNINLDIDLDDIKKLDSEHQYKFFSKIEDSFNISIEDLTMGYISYD